MERNKLKSLLPNGAQKEIAKLAGVGQAAVSNFLNGRSNTHKIEVIALQIAAKYQKEKTEANKGLEAIMG